MGMIMMTKLADKSGERTESGAWPLAGIRLDDAPEVANYPTRNANQGVEEGWLTIEGAEPQHRAGGNSRNPWAVTHTFIHATALVFHTVDGDVRYEVTSQPDKTGTGADAVVAWYYGLRKEAAE